MGKMAQELSPEAIEKLKEAQQLQRQLKSMGMGHMIEEVSQEELNAGSTNAKEEKPLVANQKPMSETNDNIDTDVPSNPVSEPVPIVTSSVDANANKTVNYENFIPIAGLPSQGIFYENTLMGQPLKVEDLLLIQTMDETNVTQRFNEIFTRRLRGVDQSDLLIMDELYISLWLRANSFPDYGFPDDGFVCQNDECDFELNDPEYEIGFGSIEYEIKPSIDEIKKLYSKTGYIQETLKSGRIIRIYPRRRVHETIVDNILNKKYYKLGKVPEPDYDDLLRLACVVDIGSETDDVEMIVADIKQLPAMDFVEVLKLVNKYSPVAIPVVKHKCPMCEEVTPVKGYPFRPEIYLPIDQ